MGLRSSVAVAVASVAALIQPLGEELPYAANVAIKKKKQKHYRSHFIKEIRRFCSYIVHTLVKIV